jgi:hypothetical protein
MALHYQNIVYRQQSIEIVQAADTRTNYEISQKTNWSRFIEQKTNQKIILISLWYFFLCTDWGLFRRYQFINKTKKIIEREKIFQQPTANILPEENKNSKKMESFSKKMS